MSLRAGLEDKYVTVNGRSIRYIEKGSGRPLVCIHSTGISLSADQWLVSIDALSVSSHVYALDMPGWGLSDYPGQGYSFPMWTSTIKGFCDALGLEQVDVAGQALGAWFATLFASEYPGLVRRVILVSLAGLGPPPRGVASGAQFQLPDREQLRHALWMEWTGFVPITGAILDEQERRMQRPGRVEQFTAIRSYLNDPAVREEFSPRRRLPAMQMPVLVAWGDDSPSLRVDQAFEAFNLLPNPRLLVTYGGDHNPMGFNAPEFQAAATAFLTAEEIKPVK